MTLAHLHISVCSSGLGKGDGEGPGHSRVLFGGPACQLSGSNRVWGCGFLGTDETMNLSWAARGVCVGPHVGLLCVGGCPLTALLWNTDGRSQFLMQCKTALCWGNSSCPPCFLNRKMTSRNVEKNN